MAKEHQVLGEIREKFALTLGRGEWRAEGEEGEREEQREEEREERRVGGEEGRGEEERRE